MCNEVRRPSPRVAAGTTVASLRPSSRRMGTAPVARGKKIGALHLEALRWRDLFDGPIQAQIDDWHWRCASNSSSTRVAIVQQVVAETKRHFRR